MGFEAVDNAALARNPERRPCSGSRLRTSSETLDDTYINFTRPAAEAIGRHDVARVLAVIALGCVTQ